MEPEAGVMGIGLEEYPETGGKVLDEEGRTSVDWACMLLSEAFFMNVDASWLASNDGDEERLALIRQQYP